MRQINTPTILTILLLFLSFIIQGQDIHYARSTIETLAGESMYGRGYVKGGDKKAASFIAKEFKKLGLRSFAKNYFQEYHFSINTFPANLSVSIDQQLLIPGVDYLVAASSPSIEGTFPIVRAPVGDGGIHATFEDTNAFIVTTIDRKKLEKGNPYTKSAGLIHITDPAKKLWWHVSNGYKVNDYPILYIPEDRIPKDKATITIEIENKFIEEYKTKNVAGYVRGLSQADSFVVFTAHYDHLGMMGSETYFPGANDNASGTAMVLDLARYFSIPKNRPEVSVAFILLSGEEAGLHGATYFAENPLFDLSKVKSLINLDMVGTGSEGITIVNGKVFKSDFELLKSLNKEGEYLPEIAIRGESCNSDHCPFYQKGVPAMFIYTRGKEFAHYHDIGDRPEEIPLTKYNELFRLLSDYVIAKE